MSLYACISTAPLASFKKKKEICYFKNNFRFDYRCKWIWGSLVSFSWKLQNVSNQTILIFDQIGQRGFHVSVCSHLDRCINLYFYPSLMFLSASSLFKMGFKILLMTSVFASHRWVSITFRVDFKRLLNAVWSLASCCLSNPFTLHEPNRRQWSFGTESFCH